MISRMLGSGACDEQRGRERRMYGVMTGAEWAEREGAVHVMIRWESGSAHLACDKQNAKMHREEESGASDEQSGRERCMTMSRVRGRDICGEQWGEESSAFVELCVHVMSRGASDEQRGKR